MMGELSRAVDSSCGCTVEPPGAVSKRSPGRYASRNPGRLRGRWCVWAAPEGKATAPRCGVPCKDRLASLPFEMVKLSSLGEASIVGRPGLPELRERLDQTDTEVSCKEGEPASKATHGVELMCIYSGFHTLVISHFFTLHISLHSAYVFSIGYYQYDITFCAGHIVFAALSLFPS